MSVEWATVLGALLLIVAFLVWVLLRTRTTSSQPKSNSQSQPDDELPRITTRPGLAEIPRTDAQNPTSDLTAPSPRKPIKRWPFVVSIIALSVIAAGLAAGLAYSTNSAQEWRNSAQESDAKLVSMTTQRNDLSKQAADLRSQLGDMTAQYNTASDRIRSLSNEKAQTGDEAAYYATILVLSRSVTSGMDACIRDLQTLQTYLVKYASYDPVALGDYARQINTGCNQARSASDDLSRKLAGR
ncbi:chorismate mutase [Arthrobacter sp. UYNi723]